MRKFVVVSLILGALIMAGTYFGCPCSANKLGKSKLGKTLSGLKWTDCDGTGSPYFSIDSINVTGDFSAGSTATFDIIGNVNKNFVHGSNDVAVKLGFIQVFNQNVPMNPVKSYTVGRATMSSSNAVKQDAPNGGYTLTIRLNDTNKNRLQCVQVTYRLS